MNQTAQSSQVKKIIGWDKFSTEVGIIIARLTVSDNSHVSVGILVSEIENIVKQINVALSLNQETFTTPDGRKFAMSAELMSKFRHELAQVWSDNFVVSRGGRGAHVVAGSPSDESFKGAPSAHRGRKQNSKVPAQAVRSNNPRTSSTRGERTLPARQFNNHPKNGRRSFNAGSKSPAAAAVPISSGVRDSRRESRAVSCLREAPISRCGGVKKARRPDTEKCPKPSGVAALGNQIRTKNGRTSVVVATRKVS